MNLKLFNLPITNAGRADDTSQREINTFMDRVEVTKTSTQFVPGNPDYWSILVFYKEVASKQIQQERPKPITEEDLDPEAKNRYAALRLWRKDRAAEINLPEFMVFHNTTLLEIAYKHVRTFNDLAQIKGVADNKIQRYGDDIIAIMCAFN